MQKCEYDFTELDRLIEEGFFDKPEYVPCKEVSWKEGYVVDPTQTVLWNLQKVKEHNQSIEKYHRSYTKAWEQKHQTFITSLTQALLAAYPMNGDQAHMIASSSYNDAKSRGNCGRELLEISKDTAIEYLRLIAKYDSLRQ